MNKNELITLAMDHEIEIDESMTKAEIRAAIEDEGIDNEALVEEKEQRQEEFDKAVIDKAPAETESEVVIKMLLNVKHYTYGPYIFSKEEPFAIMDKQYADKILENNPDAFKKATPEEIKRFYA